jgi:hypothetical protein
MKTAIIIKGNPKFIEGNQIAEKFYNDLKLFLEELGYKTSFDTGEPYTTPKGADIWIGHSRGCDRLRFASTETATIYLGTKDGINHPEDKSFSKNQIPNTFHFKLTNEMREEIAKSIASQ